MMTEKSLMSNEREKKKDNKILTGIKARNMITPMPM